MKKIRKGFTLIEMVIVLFIISLLLLIMIPNLAAQKNHADERSNDAFKITLKTQAELYLENKNLDSGKVTIAELLREKYISESQQKKAKDSLKIGESDDIFESLKEQPNSNV